MDFMNKDMLKQITQYISPDEVKYVADIKSTLEDTEVEKDKQDDVIYLTKIIAFYEKFKTLNWTTECAQNYKEVIQNFSWTLETYKDSIAENIQAIIGQLNGSDISKLELPISDNPLEVINELKICVQNWYKLHEDDMEYIGCRHLTADFLAQLYKYVYLFRLNKISTNAYAETVFGKDK